LIIVLLLLPALVTVNVVNYKPGKTIYADELLFDPHWAVVYEFGFWEVA